MIKRNLLKMMLSIGCAWLGAPTLVIYSTVVLANESEQTKDCDQILMQYRSLVVRSAQTSVQSGAFLAQKFAMKQLQDQLKSLGYSDEDIQLERYNVLKTLPTTIAPTSGTADTAADTPENADLTRVVQLLDFFPILDKEQLIPIIANKEYPMEVRAKATAALFSNKAYETSFNSIHAILDDIKDMNMMLFLRTLAAVPPKEGQSPLPNILSYWFWQFGIPDRLAYPSYLWHQNQTQTHEEARMSFQYTFAPPTAFDKLKLNYLIPNWNLLLVRSYQISHLLGDEILGEIATAMDLPPLHSILEGRQQQALLQIEAHGEEIEQTMALYTMDPRRFSQATKIGITEPIEIHFKRVFEKFVERTVHTTLASAITLTFTRFQFNLYEVMSWMASEDDSPTKLNFLVEINRHLPQFARVFALITPPSLRAQAVNILSQDSNFSAEKMGWQIKLLTEGPRSKRTTEMRVLTAQQPNQRLEIIRHKTRTTVEGRIVDSESNIIDSFDLTEDLYGTKYTETSLRGSAYYRLITPWNHGGFLNFLHILEGPTLRDETVENLINGKPVGKKPVAIEWLPSHLKSEAVLD